MGWIEQFSAGVQSTRGAGGFSPLRLAKALFLVFIGLPAMALVGYAIVSFERDKSKDMIVFDNRTDRGAEVFVDGVSVGTLAPAGQHDTLLVKLAPGAKEVVVRSGSTELSRTRLHFAARTADQKNGARALYVVGPAPRYGLATVAYAEDEKDAEAPTLAPLPTPSPLAELPRDLEEFELSEIDGVFLDSTSSYGSKVVHERHICRLSESGKVGCHGFPDRP